MANTLEIASFIQRVQNADAAQRMAVAHAAGPEGAAAVKPLSALLAGDDKGVAKAADEALIRIAHYAARPGAVPEARSVSRELAQLTPPAQPMVVRRRATRLLEFVGGDDAVPTLAALLKDAELREDARLTLERIPGRASTRALEAAAKSGAAEFRPHLEQSLRHRRMTMKAIGVKA